MKLPEIAINNTQFTVVVLLLFIFLGLFAFFTMPRSEDPQFDFAAASIQVAYPGTSPLDMEKMIVDPIEKALKELDDVNEIQFSIADGLANGYVEFNYGTDPEDKFDDVQQLLAEIRDQLPLDLTRLEAERNSPTEVSILQIALISDSADYSQLALEVERLEDSLEWVNGVKAVETWGYPEQEVQILVDLDHLSQYNITLSTLNQVLSEAGKNIPGGYVNAGSRRFNVRTSGNFKSLQQINSTVIKQVDNQLIYLKDVATVSLGPELPTYEARFNGQRAVFLTVAQRAGENIYQIMDDLKHKLTQFEQTLPTSIKAEIVLDQTISVSRRVDGFFTSLLQGLVLVVLISILALGIRASLVVALTIPLALLMAVAMIDFSGFALQQMSIVGLVIALGLLVDNAIVVTENISRHKKFSNTRDASINGAAEVGWAIVSGTITTVLAFLPLAYLQSDVGSFIRSMPITVIFSLIASLIIALSITPLIASRVLSDKPQSGTTAALKNDPVINGNPSKTIGTNNLGNNFNSANLNSENRDSANLVSFDKFSRTHSQFIRRCLQRPLLVIAIALSLFVASISLFPMVGVSLFPKAEKPQFLVNITLPENSNFNATKIIASEVEDYLLTLPEITGVATNIGHGNPQIYYNEFVRGESPNFAQLFVQHTLLPLTDSEALVNRIQQQFGNYVGARVVLKEFQQGSGFNAPIMIRIIGENFDQLEQLAAQVANIIRMTEGTTNVIDPFETTRMELQVAVNRDKSALMDVTLNTIDNIVRTSLAGAKIAIYRDANGEDYDVILRTNNGGEASLDDFERLLVANKSGLQIPLRQLAELQLESVPAYFQHHNSARSLEVTADVQSGYVTPPITNEIVQQLAKITLPAGYHFEISGEQEERTEGFNGMIKSLVIALMGIFAVLVLQFRSFTQPLIVFIAIPFAITGAIVALFITGHTFSFTAFLGLTSLMGIVVNNSIILVDQANRIRDTGVHLAEAIIEATHTRFRPIILTTLTTIGGLLPMTLSGSTMWAPLGIVIIGGLIVSTLLTLILVPVIYIGLSAKYKPDNDAIDITSIPPTSTSTSIIKE
ncbi:MAG: efflux RND transporter permease subunit [Pseudomonadales bacterium]|nr:efflux RND transporter permease subunit [Pseudomonadales bacterium]